MQAYLCANNHHFRSATPRCPNPNCTAEIRPTKVDPMHGRAPDFKNLQPLPGGARGDLGDSVFMSEGGREAAQRSREKARAKGEANDTVVPESGREVKHSIRWWAYVDGGRVPRQSTMKSGQFGWDVTCSCGWESRTGGATMASLDRTVAAHKEGIL